MTESAATVSSNLHAILERMESACRASGRKAKELQLLPVSKGQTLATLKVAGEVKDFPKTWGENYWDELEQKQTALASHGIEWHFLGRLQSRKISKLASAVSVLHTVSRIKELAILSQLPRCPQFFIQVNISNEAQKNGVDSGELGLLLDACTAKGLSSKLIGLMGMATPLEESGESQVRKEFARLRELRDRLLPEAKLSMGMSSDFELAILEGADLIRLGSALFGERA